MHCASSYRRLAWSKAWLLAVSALMLALTNCEQTEEEEVGVSGKGLLEAVKKDDERRILYLLNEGVHLEVKDEKGDTPILYAIRRKNISLAKILTKRGANLEAFSGNGKGALELAIESGSLEMVEYLLTNGQQADQISRDKNPVIFTPFETRDVPMISLLLKHGADPNAQGMEGFTSLHLAAKLQFPECIRLLLQYGADTEIKDNNAATALWYALGAEYTAAPSSLGILIDAGADTVTTGIDEVPILAQAVSRGITNDVIELLNHGAVANQGENDGGHKALQVAASMGSKHMLRLLFQGGADGSQLFDQVVSNKNIEALELLLDAGLPTESWPGADKDSLMAYSVRNKSPEMIRLLARYGVIADEKGMEGEYPLNMAIGMRDVELVTALLQSGHDSNKLFSKSPSEEFLAIVKKESTRWFLKNDWRLTPLMMAANNGDPRVIKVMREYGAEKFVRSGKYKLYPINFASRRADVKSMQVMLGQNPEEEKFHAIVDLSDQRMKLYDPAGKVLFASRVSTGKSGHRTPTGEYVITDKRKKHNSTIYGSSMPYFQRFSDSAIGFHAGSVPRYPASHGCIRLPHSAAKKLYGITPVGTRVIIRK